MSLLHSPSIVTNGLIMYYDASNTQKSWKGAPTTNILEGNLSTFNDIYGNSSKTVIGSNEVQWINTGIGPTTVRLYVPQASLTNAQTYGLSVYVKDLVGTVSFDWCDQAITGVNSLTNTPGRLTGTASRSSYDSTYRFLDINLSTGGRMILYNPQVDSISYVTPYVNPTTSRSNTQAIVDLTSNNTITATSLTYASDNTFSFNGSNNYMTVPVSSVLNMPASFSLEAWVRPNSATSDRAIIILGTGSYYLTIDNAYKLSVYCYGKSPAGYHTTSESVSQGVWNHICAAWSSGEVSLYINGQLKISISTTGTPNAVSSQLWIGAEGSGASRQLNGSIGIAKIYNRALSAGEVAQNFNALRGRYGV